MTHPASLKTGQTAGMLLLGALASLLLVLSAAAEPTAAQASAPRFVYASGSQGVRYYANPGTATQARSAPAPRTSAARGTSVGPGVRDWTTGRRGRLHKPWLQPR